ncbi:MAG: hypothetical protein NUK65_09145 [Firmicutes bacterium]|nr:hypothetical protein [Bacillota bacterium]
MKKLLLVILVLLLVVVGGGYLLLHGTKTVDVQWTEADFHSYLEKGNVSFNEDRTSLEEFMLEDFVSVGASKVDGHVTNAEISAILNMASKEIGFIRDIRIKFLDNGRVEASAKVGDDLSMIYSRYPEARGYENYLNTFKGKSVYFKCTLERINNKEFAGVMEAASVGHIPLPTGQVNDYLERMGTEVNAKIASMDGFSAEEFSFDSSGLYFKGSIPQEVKVNK